MTFNHSLDITKLVPCSSAHKGVDNVGEYTLEALLVIGLKKKRRNSMKNESEMSGLDPSDVQLINAIRRREMYCQMARTGDLHVPEDSTLNAVELIDDLPFASLFPRFTNPPDIRIPFS